MRHICIMYTGKLTSGCNYCQTSSVTRCRKQRMVKGYHQPKLPKLLPLQHGTHAFYYVVLCLKEDLQLVFCVYFLLGCSSGFESRCPVLLDELSKVCFAAITFISDIFSSSSVKIKSRITLYFK